MKDKFLERNKKEKMIIKLASLDDSKIEKLTYKEKQKCFKAKSRVGRYVFISKNNDGKGITYRKGDKLEN